MTVDSGHKGYIVLLSTASLVFNSGSYAVDTLFNIQTRTWLGSLALTTDTDL